ncbi:MAG: extracellular solute-binding protein [Alphaproteobacteria bacterium]|nr:extracellular solute-binding protein [Alphaproteobacteria bacterium]
MSKSFLGRMALDGPFAAPTRRQVALGMGALGSAGVLGLRPRDARADSVNWMGWQGYDECFNAGSFLADSGITMEKTYINANEEIITKLAAGGTGSIDLITMYFGYLPIMAAAGMLEPFDVTKVPNAADVIPQFLNNESIRYDGKLYGVPWTWGFLPMVYDPAAIPTPTSWMDVLKDEYKGKVVMIDDPLGNLMVWGRVVTGAEHSTILTHDQLKQTIDFLINVKKNHARAFAGYGEASDMFARGEVVISALGWEAMVGFAATAGKKIDFVIPQEGTAMYMDCQCIPAGSPHPDEAYAIANQCLSVEGQAKIVEVLTQGITNLKAIAKTAPEHQAIYSYSDIDAFLKKARMEPMPPTESGDTATYDDFLEEYDRLLKA